jgi:hypothetical protein
MCSVKRLTLTACGGAVLALVMAAGLAHAQRFAIPGTGGTLNPRNYYDAYGFSRQAAFNIGLYGRSLAQVPAYSSGYNPYQQAGGYGSTYGSSISPYASAYGSTAGYSPAAAYSSPGYTNPGYGSSSGYGSGNSAPDTCSGFLQGSATLINADGRFRMNNQQANLQREQVRSAHIENNRKAFDEFLYERANTPPWLDHLERQKKLNLRYALTIASGSDILTGNSLNTLLDSLKEMQANGVQGPDVTLSVETLGKINVTAGSGINSALLKSERLTWPLALTGIEFQDDRNTLERKLAAAVRDAEMSQVAPKQLKDLSDAVDTITDRLGRQIGRMTPNQNIEAKNYLKLLCDGIRALARPDAANYINGKYCAKGKTVAGLVKNMSGLQFAPATPGSDRAYKELYEQLVTYYERAQPSARGE